MESVVLDDLVKQGKTQREIAEILGKSKTTVRYWLEKHNLLGSRRVSCNKCGETDVAKFLKGRWHTCKKCRANLATERHRKLKRKAVAYKGGECELCGYKKCLGALDFHHLNPEEKDLKWRTMRSWTFEKVKQELDKCMLVCKNCHAEIHYGNEVDLAMG